MKWLLTLSGGYPDGIWCCSACMAPLTEGVVTHLDDCPDSLGAVYAWLVNELGFPFDMCTTAKPPWLDIDLLAAAWAKRDGETVEIYRAGILDETGWPA